MTTTPNYAIPMQPRRFRRLRRLVWTIRCFFEYRRRLNKGAAEKWPVALLWQTAVTSAANEADSNDAHGWAWGSPADAAQAELDCWDHDE